MELRDEIDDRLADWLTGQPVFFVATAPRSDDGHVNVSPKGMGGTFAVLGPRQVGYLDYYGSGSETIAHLRENGRITLMFAAFSGRPNIVRLFGRGRVVLAGDAEFDGLRARFPKDRVTGQRSIIVADLDRIQDSCGYAVPFMDFVGPRTVLDLHQEKKGADRYLADPVQGNAYSIDGLPALADRSVRAAQGGGDQRDG